MKKNSYIIYGFIVCVLASCQGTDKGELKNKEEYIQEDLEYYIPFDQTDYRQILIKTDINGVKDVLLLLDNGCRELCLAEDFVKKNHAALGIVIPDNKNPGMDQFSYEGLPTLYVAEGEIVFKIKDSVFPHRCQGGFVKHDQSIVDKFCYVYDNTNNPLYLPEGVAGVMPLRTLAQKGLIKINLEKRRIDFPKEIDSTLIFYDASSDPHFPTLSMPFTFYSKDKKPYNTIIKTLIDLGSGLDFCIPKGSKIKKTLMPYTEGEFELSSRFIEKSVFVDLLPFIKVGINKDQMIFHYIKFYYLGYMNVPQVQLIMGVRSLQKLDMYFDYERQKFALHSDKKELYLEPEKGNFKGVNFSDIKIGDSLFTYISSIWRDSSVVDFKLNDIILQADSFSFVNLDIWDFRDILRQTNKPGKPEKITILRNGKQMELHTNKIANIHP